jgi:hypothetical protein
MTPRRRLGALLLAPVLLAAGARASAAAPFRLLAPAPGDELAAGSLAPVEWQGAPAEAEEWEAFLSLDGGRTYPLRVTPHLDVSIRRFTFRVPPIPTRQARLMLRFGDERRETELETASRFAIVPGTSWWSPDMATALSRGERPRPRDPGVVVWVEGSRDGGGLRQVAAGEQACSVRSVEPARLPWIPLVAPPRDGAGGLAAALPPAFRTAVPVDLQPEPPSPPVRTSVRVLTGRRNE